MIPQQQREDTMSRWSRLIPVVAGTVLFAACGQGSTDNPLAPAPARHDGGLLVGGNVTPPPDTTTKSTSTSNSTGTAETAPADTTTRGGGLLVGGN
jgi:hypothetical protein